RWRAGPHGVVAMSVLHRGGAFADHGDLITLVSRGPVVVEGVGQLSVATEQMRGVEHDPGQRVGDTTALAVPLGQRHVDGAFLPVVHESGAPRHAVADHSAGGEHAVAVDRFDPVVVRDARGLGVLHAHPDVLPAAGQVHHVEVLLVHGVDRPLVVGGQVAHADPTRLVLADRAL